MASAKMKQFKKNLKNNTGKSIHSEGEKNIYSIDISEGMIVKVNSKFQIGYNEIKENILDLFLHKEKFNIGETIPLSDFSDCNFSLTYAGYRKKMIK